MTHDGLLLATVVTLLQDGQIKIIQVKLSLKCKFVIGVENIEREHSFRSLKRRGVPAYPQKLAVLFNPLSVLRARTKLHVDTVSSIGVNHEDDLSS